MKNSLMRNLGLKILSLLIAILVWIAIVNYQDPVVEKTFRDINVTVKNEDVITEIDKVYTITQGETVDITVRGKKKFVESLRTSDLKAEADLNELSVTNAAYITPICTKYTSGDYTLMLGKVKMLVVTLEDKQSSKFPIDISLTDDVDSSYYINEKVASPNLITVSGAESLISKIQKVVIEMSVQGLTQSFEKVVPSWNYKVYDSNGDLIDNSKLEFSTNEIAVEISIVKTKEVNLNINLIGDVRTGYEISEFDYEPKKITIAGNQEDLEQVNEITYDYDITGQYENHEVNLYNQVLEVIKGLGVVAVDDNQSIAVSVKFEKLETQEIDIDVSDIEIKDLPEDYEVEINTNSITALVQGGSDEIKNLKASDLKPYIELDSYELGTRLVDLQFADSDNYEVLNKPILNITLRLAQSGTQNGE